MSVPSYIRPTVDTIAKELIAKSAEQFLLHLRLVDDSKEEKVVIDQITEHAKKITQEALFAAFDSNDLTQFSEMIYALKMIGGVASAMSKALSRTVLEELRTLREVVDPEAPNGQS